MTRYTQLRHAGYYNPQLTDQERAKIAAQVDGTPATKAKTSPSKTTTPKGKTA